MPKIENNSSFAGFNSYETKNEVRVKQYWLSSVKKNELFRVKQYGLSIVKENELFRVLQYGLSSVKKNELGDTGLGKNRHCKKRLDRFRVRAWIGTQFTK